MPKTNNKIQIAFKTNRQAEEVVTKSFKYDPSITDDRIAAFAKVVADNQIFLDGHGDILTAVNDANRIAQTKTDVIISPEV